MELTEQHARRARAHAQLLAGEPAGTVGAVAAALVGVQAQDPVAAALSIRARTTKWGQRDAELAPSRRHFEGGLVVGDVERALGPDGDLVLTWSLRGTRHYHAREDVRWLLSLLGPVFARPGARAARLGIAGPTGDRAVRALREVLAAEGPLRRDEVRERLASSGVDPSGQAPVHVIRRAALEGVVCVIPSAGGDERYALLDQWLGPAHTPDHVDRRGALGRLARRYLAAFGPASPDDFATWSGLGPPAARQAWSELAGEVAEVAVGDGAPAWVLAERADAVAATGAHPCPVRLVGGFDSFVLGYRHRSLLLDPAHATLVNAGGGMVRPLVVIDGGVAGTWALRRQGRHHRAEVAPFRPLTRAQTSAVEAEVADVGRFLDISPTPVIPQS